MNPLLQQFQTDEDRRFLRDSLMRLMGVAWYQSAQLLWATDAQIEQAVPLALAAIERHAQEQRERMTRYRWPHRCTASFHFMNTIKSTITLAGKQYATEVGPNGKFVDGIPISEFVDKLANEGRWDAVTDLAQIGLSYIRGDLPGGSPQVAANILEAGRKQSN